VLRQHVKAGTFVVFSGSLPTGCTPEQLQGLIQVAQDQGALVIVDTSGSALNQAIHWHPFAIKPNLSEFLSLGGADLPEDSIKGQQPELRWILNRLHELNQMSIELPIVTLGAQGALAMFDGRAYKVMGPVIHSLNPVGSGDAFLGGLVHGLTKGHPLMDALKLAAATGIVNAQAASAGMIDKENVLQMSENIKVEIIM